MHKATRHTVIKLALIAVAMFVAVFTILPPLYTLLCEMTGLRTVEGRYEAKEIAVDRSRAITVRLVGTRSDSMAWDFFPMEYKVTVNPGEKKTVRFFARNNTNNPMVAKAVPSLSPFNAVNYFHKIECFCFNEQPLAAGESAELALQFVVDQDLPDKVTTITLSYTLFDITEPSQTSLAVSQQP